ncbi:hypothetical protein AKJ57_06765 [candidate division MSBL1 archaeon SCGC-AAA259A05]|uniref:Uncharacterized protein n=1 Tax=candidate division MSBL1 archaeon SCGC-AAA259A05 TaxID=1698259 RepID=A0A133U2X8_9EURY|nr:hypothetical protein AKJ57_06765 [candidate division MSBL1 archaeon SCGC-AAA259A05]
MSNRRVNGKRIGSGRSLFSLYPLISLFPTVSLADPDCEGKRREVVKPGKRSGDGKVRGNGTTAEPLQKRLILRAAGRREPPSSGGGGAGGLFPFSFRVRGKVVVSFFFFAGRVFKTCLKLLCLSLLVIRIREE